MVPTGAQLVSPDGATTFELTAGFTIPQGGSVTSAAIVAVTKGPQGNLVAGTTLTWLAPPQGLSPRLVLTTGTKGGTAAEDDVDLVLRLLRRMQQPPKGGTPNDWRTWTEEATDENGISLGIARGFIFGRRNGTLSVDVVPMKAGLGTDRDPGSTVAGKLLTYLLARKVVTDNVRVVRPRFVAGEALTLLLGAGTWAGVPPALEAAAGLSVVDGAWAAAFEDKLDAEAPHRALAGVHPAPAHRGRDACRGARRHGIGRGAARRNARLRARPSHAPPPRPGRP